MGALQTRLVFGSLMTALAVGMLWADGQDWPVRVILVPLLAAAAQAEFYKMASKAGWPPNFGLGIFAGLVWTTRDSLWPWGEISLEAFTTVFVLLLLMRAVLFSQVTAAPAKLGVTLLGFFAVPFLFGYLLKLPWEWLVFCIAVAKAGDISAYFVGSRWGSWKLIPAVSPNKSWQGAGASVLGSLLAGYLWARLMGSENVTATLWISAALVTNIAAQFGDLGESILKRGCGVKDSSPLIPVMGGTFDLVDSFLFAAPVLFAFLYFQEIVA